MSKHRKQRKQKVKLSKVLEIDNFKFDKKGSFIIFRESLTLAFLGVRN